jgi:hypothetical protein
MEQKKAGPLMEMVRYPPGVPPLFVIDVQIDAVTGLVKGRLGGVSTFSAPNSHRQGGKWWMIPASTTIDSRLYLYDPMVTGHWWWAPDHDMTKSDFEQALASVNGSFR